MRRAGCGTSTSTSSSSPGGWWASTWSRSVATSSEATSAAAVLDVRPSARAAVRLERLRPSPVLVPPLLPRPRPGQRLDELLELAGGPALERAAIPLVRGDDRVAVVPVQSRLGVQPERAPRLLGHLREHVGARIAAVGARIAEHDDGGARVQVVL